MNMIAGNYVLALELDDHAAALGRRQPAFPVLAPAKPQRSAWRSSCCSGDAGAALLDP